MNRLSLDLSLPEGSISVEKDGELLSTITWNRPKVHAEVVYREIDRALSLAGLEREEIDEVVVCSGPGSFTGVRLSVTVGKAFKVLGVKVLSATTLTALAFGYEALGFDPVALLPARRERFYVKLGNFQGDLTVEEVEEKLKLLKKPLIVFKGELPPQLTSYSNFRELTPLSVKLLKLPKEELSQLTFHYIREHDAKPPNKRG